MTYVESTLLPNEIIIYEAKVHWAVYLKPAFFALLMLLSFVQQPVSEGTVIVGLLFFVLAISTLIQAIIARMTTEMVITNKRVVSKFGFIRRETYEPQLTQLEGAYLSQSLLGRVLGYGEVQVKGTGGGGAPVPFIADPIQFRNTLAPLLG